MAKDLRITEIPPSLMPEHMLQSGGLETEDLSLRQAIRIVRKRKYVVLSIALLIGALVLVGSLVMRPYYSSTAVIEVQKNQGDVGGAMGAAASSLTGEDDVKTAIQTEVSILESDELGIETIERTHYEDHQKQGKHLFKVPERAPEERGLPLNQAPKTRGSLLGSFESHLKIVPVPDTRLIQVTFEDPNPKFASEVSNALIDQYVQDRLQRRDSSTLQATGWMTGELDDLKKQVQTAEQNLIDYQRQSGLIVLPGGSSGSAGSAGQTGGTASATTNPVIDRVTQLNTSLVAAETNRISQEALYHLAKSGNVDALANTATTMQASGVGSAQSGLFAGLLALRQEEMPLKLQLASAEQTYGAKNPHLVDLESQMESLNREIKVEVGRILNTTEMNYKAALQTEDGIRKAYGAEEQQAFKMNDSAIRLAVLQQEADSTRSLYEDLYTKLQESKLSVGTQSSNIAVISHGLTSSSPMRPKKGLYTAVGLMVGVVLGVLATFLLESLDDRVSTIEEVEKLSALPVLAAIPQVIPASFSLSEKRKSGNMLGESARHLYLKPASEASEAYRSLRTAILLSRPGKPPRSLLVGSALPGEGKTTTCYGLGACFAMLGNRVLVVDADMRRPALHRHARVKNNRGLSNLLTSTSDPKDFIQEDVAVKDLFILPAGPAPPNPAELLGAGEFAHVLETLCSMFDLVLIDSPPSLVVTDASIMSVKVDEVLLVVRWGSTTRSALTRLFETFRRNRARVLGAVVNGVNTRSTEYYYDRGYYGREYLSEEREAINE